MLRKGEGPARRIARAPHDRATTYSPAFNSTIGALGLTSVFGMDTGVAPTLWSPGNLLFPKERVFSLPDAGASSRVEFVTAALMERTDK